MTLPAPTYDLVLLLDPQADDATRAKLVADARAAIEAQGELLRHDAWGERALSYPIDRKTSAEYHLLQFHIGTTELLNDLDRTLRLADEVLRHRIIKLAPGVAAPPDMAASAGARRAEGESAASGSRLAAPAESSAPAESAAPTEAAASAVATTSAAEPATAAPADGADAEVAVAEPS